MSDEDTAAAENGTQHASSPLDRTARPPFQPPQHQPRQRNQRTQHQHHPHPPHHPRPPSTSLPSPSGAPAPTLSPLTTSMPVPYPVNPAPGHHGNGHHAGIHRPNAGYEPYRPQPPPPRPAPAAQLALPVYRPPPPQMGQGQPVAAFPTFSTFPTFQLSQPVSHYDAETGAQTSLQQQIALLQSNRVALEKQRDMMLQMRGKVPGY